MKMVTIIGSYNVLPSQPTPNGRLWLSYIDQIVLRHTPTIYIYKTKQNDHDTVIERMRDSLSKILVHYYPIAGRLRRIVGGRFEIDCNAKGVMLLEAETTKTLQDYGEFSSESNKDLVPSVDYTSQPLEELPLLIVQVTRFHNGDGDDGEAFFAVGVAFCHHLSDGAGAIQFINSWGKVARGEPLESNEMPFLDRTVLKFTHSAQPPRFDHLELKALPLILGRNDNILEREKKTVAASLKLTPQQVDKLKKKANDEEYSPKKDHGPRRPYSRFEAIAAHIWRCASKARELDDNQPTLARFNADMRTRLNPPLPRNYFGNALALTATASHVGEVVSSSLGYVASKIREAIEIVTDEYIRSQMDSKIQNEGKDASLFYGNPNLHITSWMSMPAYEADFGWGKPMHFGIGDVSRQDRALILQSPDADGSVVVSIHFQVAHIQQFKKFFYEDI